GGIARGIYVTATGRRVVVLHVFAKKSRKTPLHALATARERMKQVMT
ncbi:MAG: type II toxin-antitoxin system RelE/ParE family toxin, partial [Pseudomonadales bacterium]|nr:type II toxin-antitoxin system RelE/ParE family toxin [Pseudomonadales bacterium]